MKRTSLFVLLVSPISAFAAGISTPFTFESTELLPQGVRSVQVIGFTTELADRFNGSGSVEPLAAKMNRPISFQELADGQPAAADRVQLKALLNAKEIPMGASVGDALGVVNSRVTATVPVLAYGLTANLTAAVIVPVLYTNTNVSVGWSSSDGLQKTLDGLSNEGLHNKKLSFESQLLNVVQTKVTGYGYEPLQSREQQEVGDVSLGLKYSAMRGERFKVVTTGKITAPTGRTQDLNRLVDLAPGDGQWDVGLGVAASYQWSPSQNLVAALSVLSQLPVQFGKRIPIQRWEAATPDIDSETQVDLGDSFSASLANKTNLSEEWTLSGQLQFQYKEPDRYRGAKFVADRYQWMSDETEQSLQSAHVGISYNTISLYKKGAFAVPFETSMIVAKGLAGMNVPVATMAAWQLALFF